MIGVISFKDSLSIIIILYSSIQHFLIIIGIFSMKPEDVAAVTFVDLDTVNKIKLAMGI